MHNFLSFTEFVNKLKIVESICSSAIEKDIFFEDFLDDVLAHDIMIEEVVTGDIAQVTPPLACLKRKQVYEVAPKGEEAERFILKNKEAFKKRYGDEWEQILYATAWKMFGNKK